MYGNLLNTDYEGQLQAMGDTVRINAIGDVTVSTYSKDSDIAAAQALTDAQSVLTISQARYFNFEIDDIDQAQAHPRVMQEATAWAAYRLADTQDQYYAGFDTDASSANVIGSSGSPVTPNYASMNTTTGLGTGQACTTTSCSSAISHQSLVPKQGRSAVIPPGAPLS